MHKNRRYITITLLSFLIFCRVSSAQERCDCLKEFNNVRSYIEANYAGYKDKVTDLESFNKFTTSLSKQALLANNRTYCIEAIAEWLFYFNDDHIQLINNAQKKIDSIQSISLDSSQLNKLNIKSTNDIEGIYVAPNQKYKIAITKSITPFREYVGTVLSSTNKEWKANQVKIELKHISDYKYDAILYIGDHSAEIRRYTIRDGKFDPPDYQKLELQKESPTVETEPFPKIENSRQIVAFKKISDSATYIRIKSFHDRFSKKIDDIIKENMAAIESSPYLILDLRYNGGGSDFSYNSLLPLIYSKPISLIGADVLSTPANIEAWQKVISDNPKLPKEIIKQLDSTIQQMKAHPNSFISIADNETYTEKNVLRYPKKIAILIDRDCASSTEEFLIAAKQSDKVVLIGENTAGVLDYSNMRMTYIKCLEYSLGYSTSRSRRLPQAGIDELGIAPTIKEDFSAGWLDRVLKYISH